MGALFSLTYFEDIFDDRGDDYRKLLKTLIVMLDDYADEYEIAVLSRDEANLSFVRHKNIPLIDNLKLSDLREIQSLGKGLVEKQAALSELKENVRQFKELVVKIHDGLLDVLHALES